MDIHVKIIPNDQHRPGITGADWWFDESGNLEVRISKMSDSKYESVLAVHEVVEAVLCRYAGVTHEAVDAFDIPYHQKNEVYDLDAGDEPEAPYRRQHGFATAAERIVASEIGIPWLAYDKELAAL